LPAVDNGPREGLEKFLNAASDDPDTVLHYEFMQDYKVHLKHLDGRNEEVSASDTGEESRLCPAFRGSGFRVLGLQGCRVVGL
jgi:coenzyme F420-reducing hydrogenase beta subunit